MLEPVFESRALVEVQVVAAGTAADSSPPGISSAAALAENAQFLHSEFMNTQREIVASATVAGVSRPSLRVEVVPQTHLLAVHYLANDPRTAQAGAESVVSAYVDYTARTQVEQIADAAALLIRKLESVIDAPALNLRDVGVIEEPFADFPVTANLPVIAELLPPPLPLATPLQSFEGLGDALVQRVVESYDDSLDNLVDARVIDSASLPQEPLPGPHPLWIFLGYLSAVAVPAAILLARFYWRDTLDFSTDTQRQLGLPCLGSLPAVHAGVDPDGAMDAGFGAAVHSLRTAVQLLRAPQETLEQFPCGRIILVTSGSKGEGKTTVATNLALALGRMEKVLLIDADMRGKRSCLGVPAGAPGLSHLIAGAAQLRDCMHSLVDRRVDVIPAGIMPPNPQELLASKRFRRVLDMLERRYDTIVVDAPALEDARDTLQLARHCSDLLFVIGAGGTRVANAREHLTQLSENGVKVSGVVLNRVGHAGQSAGSHLESGQEQMLSNQALSNQAQGTQQSAAGTRAFA
ncbi:MAG: polysaccharide biosynthesis tyrosine autokinase [Gammaproteobacteria bacterium]|nr:polysaccharide biosynthesis tyrosine autokinase [Gammaproteobacteria bacterium]